jgi:murein DD-endopeptidase MepM/ murein hydrolase activator NlpD
MGDVDMNDPSTQAVIEAADRAAENDVAGPFLADGTLLKPIAVDTVVADGSGLMRTYKVKTGDTLSGIAKKYDVSMMTLWWANDLKTKALHKGQKLTVPPVTGLVVEIKSTDTLTAIATKYKVTEREILDTNGITDSNLVVGQVLILPGAKGKAIPTPKATKKPAVTHTSSRGGSTRPPKSYGGGNFRWPTSSHHISQYYHYGHYGLDIDGSTGDPIYAAAGGTVQFAGWKSNGGGYQVWIAHGSGLYTTYNHMSSVSVGRGQHVGRGQRVGRMGASGNASGSHLHFEVWKGPIWSGGRRVNPLGYL